MTSEIDLLPLPKWMSNYTIPSDGFECDKDVILADRMHDYASANIAHATATLQAEVKALREALKVLVNWTPSADTYRRMGFDPEAPMRAHEAAKAALAKGASD